ncbi:MAG: hypothetical protein MUP97_05315 [Acidimicrobiia bacterium]|nr:hypothetical protein [Acidimicrobiia bacterium]
MGTARGGRPPLLSGRRVGIAVLVIYVGAFLAFMVMVVPVVAPRLPHSEAARYWPIAVLAAGLVMLVDAVVVFAWSRRGRRLTVGSSPTGRARDLGVPERDVVERQGTRHGRRRVRTHRRLTAAASAVLLVAALVSGYPLWVLGLAALIPWVPFFTVETIRTSQSYGFYAFFVVVVGFQLLHMGEHTVQVLQLALTDGDLVHSHGVLGQLDFEVVHFASDILVWLAVCALVWVYGGRSPWLWVAFAAASMHAIEHFYLFSIYIGHRGFYDRGGFAGIMGEGGLTGSPLARPYMHFAYNFIVLVPLVLAWWDQMPRSTARTRSRSRTKPTRSYPLISLPDPVSSEANLAEEFAASAGVVQR